MKNLFKFAMYGAFALTTVAFVACSDDNDPKLVQILPQYQPY